MVTPRKKKIVTWVLTLGRETAKVYEVNGRRSRPVEIMEVKSPVAHLREQDLVTDRPGSGTYSKRAGKYPLPPHSKKKEQGLQRFMRLVVGELSALKKRGRFDSLIVMAEPRTLGKLRAAVRAQNRFEIDGEIRRDLIKAPPRVIERELKGFLEAEEP